MIADQFKPFGVECLIRTAVELWQGANTASLGLSEHQQKLLSQALAALEADHVGHPPATPPQSVLGAVGERAPVWVLNTWDKNNDVYTLHASETSAQTALAAYTRSRWDAGALHGDEAPTPPQDDMKAIDLFYGPQEECEEVGYSIYQEKVHN